MSQPQSDSSQHEKTAEERAKDARRRRIEREEVLRLTQGYSLAKTDALLAGLCPAEAALDGLAVVLSVGFAHLLAKLDN